MTNLYVINFITFKHISFRYGKTLCILIFVTYQTSVNMSTSRSNSSCSGSSSEPEWDPDGPDLLQESVPNMSKEEKNLKRKFTFDDHWKEFSDLRIYKMQSTQRFYSLQSLVKFPSQPFFSSIFSVFNSKTAGYRVERFLQRRFCLNFCTWNPTVCFLEDSHSGCLEDLMSAEFHKLHNPDFEYKFNQQTETPKLIYDVKNSPPNMNKLLQELGISSSLTYIHGKAVNFDYLGREFRYFERPFFLMEEKKCLDVITALIQVTEHKFENHRNEMLKLYQKRLNVEISKPILSLMMWGPQPNNDFPISSQTCKLEIDPDHRCVVEENLHKCKYFIERDYWMFTHGDEIICNQETIDSLDGPSMTENLTVVYPCNKHKCRIACSCQLCEQTRTNICPLEHHKKHLTRFDKICPVQIFSQCQEHWVSHPDNFILDEDILVEKNLFYHNQELVHQPRSYAVEIIRFAGIKKSCLICRTNVQNHFEKHLDFHLQCKFCLFQLATLENPGFWKKVCNVCGKLMANFSPKQIQWHRKVHDGEKFECSLCGAILKRKFTLERHMKEIHNEEWIDQSVVNQILNNFDEPEGENIESEYTESDETTDENTDYDESSSEEIETGERSSKCDHCGKEFKLKRYLEMHISNKHGDENLPFKCDECDAQYKYKYHLKRHKITEHKVCDGKYTFPDNETFQGFSCQICSRNFKRKDYLKKHLIAHQQSKDVYSCDNCGKNYGRKDTLTEHIRTNHLNVAKSFTCDLCGKKFQKKFNLRRHRMVIHNI